jgi:hypothetical protein
MNGSPSRKARERGEIKNDMRRVPFNRELADSSQKRMQVQVKGSDAVAVCAEMQVCCITLSASAPWRHGGLNE